MTFSQIMTFSLRCESHADNCSEEETLLCDSFYWVMDQWLGQVVGVFWQYGPGLSELSR